MRSGPAKPRPSPRFELISALTKLGYQKIVGIDEVGRGALAGPLVVAAVDLPIKIPGITDSKLLSISARENLAQQIHQLARQICFGQASVEEIDMLGLTKATGLAYSRALESIQADLILTDFVRLPGRKFISQPQGDRYFYPTAAASVVAKVYRDQLMRQQHQNYPHYGWLTNVGYGTPFHRQAIRQYHLTPLHRKSFCQ